MPTNTTNAPAPATANTPAPTGTMFDNLPDQLKQVNSALESLAGVLFGDGFKHDDIWGEASKIEDSKIGAYLKTLPLKDDIKSAIDSVMKQVSKVPPIKSAIDTLIGGLGTAMQGIQKAQVKVDEAQAAVAPVLELSKKLFPAITDVVKSAGGPDLTGEVNTALGYIKGAQAVARLVGFGTGMLDVLQTKLQAAA